jgi:serine/threonine protein kinase
VKRFCRLLARSRLFSRGDLPRLHRRWQRTAGARARLQSFIWWLVAHSYLTDYQVRRLRHGHADHFFLDHYKILERVGQGRLARVYRAAQPDGEEVALKVLSPCRARDPGLRARFEQEARISRWLSHPHVVCTYRAGQDGRLRFLVMEYLDGETLEQVLRRRGRLPPAEAARLVYQALLGLEHLHCRGLVHGDLEPANLMIVPGPLVGQPDTTLYATVKILDAGPGSPLLVEAARATAESLLATGAGRLQGSAADLAPEWVSDRRGGDIRADIYSLGCNLYQCLTGRPPFPDGNALRQLIRHVTEAPAPLAALVPGLPGGLEQVIGRMLAKDPARRYPTPAAAARALLPFFAEVPNGAAVDLAACTVRGLTSPPCQGQRAVPEPHSGRAALACPDPVAPVPGRGLAGGGAAQSWAPELLPPDLRV